MTTLNWKFSVFVTLIWCTIASLYLIGFFTNNYLENVNNLIVNNSIDNEFLVNSDLCKIRALSPFSEDVQRLISKANFGKCPDIAPLTSITHDYVNDVAKIILHKELMYHYISWYHNQLECCYKEITRSGMNESADNEFRLSDCNYFDETFELPKSVEYILVSCDGFREIWERKLARTVYVNSHAIVRNKFSNRVMKDNNQKDPAINIMLFGLDGISRLNLMRTMPLTTDHLNKNGWFELQGYNKVADNTLPNLMAILTGLNSTLFYEKCDPRIVGGLDKCNFIWKQFEREGYATAYVEDEMKITTFNYYTTGFLNSPTNHYFRPFALASEKFLNIKKRHGLKNCLGYQYYVEYLFQYALDFGSVYKNHPHFGLFWENSFSHEDISDPQFFDNVTKTFLVDLEIRGILENTVVIFFSDHGMRFGPIRNLLTGWYEERMPFIFIWLPEWFKKKYPQYANNLKVNRNRLTNPYDIHMTLQHLLEISSGNKFKKTSAESCPNCQSLLNIVPYNRSCEDAAINLHYCTCTPYTETDPTTTVVKNAIQFTIDYLNKFIEEHGESLCAELDLKNINLARKSLETKSNSTDYLIVFVTRPANAKLEATVRYFSNSETFELIGSVSRLDQYGNQSSCVKNNKDLKKYCYCKEYLWSFI